VPAETVRTDPPRETLRTLTPAEAKVLALIGQGRTNRSIARELDVRETTVKNHVRSIFLKLRVSTRTEAALVLLRPHRDGQRPA
jgi:DNA-binding NarL/FixJ family response regulator